MHSRPVFLRVCSATIAIASTVMPFAATAQQGPANLGFELRNGPRPVGWGIGGTGYEIVADSAAPFAGAFSLRSRWLGPAVWVPGTGSFGSASQVYPLPLARGRHLLLTGYIRTEDVAAGYAGFWMRVDHSGGPSLAFDNMAQRGPRGTTPWTKYQIDLPVDSGATGVVFGALHSGNGSAWFDSLTIQVVGDPMPRTAVDIPPFRPEVRPVEDMTRLLTDAELALPLDTGPPPRENPLWTNWVRAHAQPVRSLGATDFSDLRFFEPLLRGKRIVQLGESGHGVAEFDMAKVRLIKYLHEALGYDVIAFESSLFECHRAQHAIASLTAIQLMQSCIFGVWHTDETVPLFEYIKQTQATAHPLILAGFDEQTSSLSASARPAFFRRVIAQFDAPYAARVYTQDSVFLASYRGADPTKAAHDEPMFVAFYDTLATWLRVHERAIVAALPDDPQAAVVARQAAISMTFFARQIAAGQSPAGTDIRDRGMADNLDVLLSELYPGKKVIVWAHNFHIEHRIDAVAPPAKTMGVWTAERHRAELYTIGLYMYRGSAAMNNRVPYAVSRMQAGSLESIMHAVPWRYSYLDLANVPLDAAGAGWMSQTIPAMEWGTSMMRIVPRNEYDGILFIDTTHPPHYVRIQ